jgi:hypothetical protein
MALQSSKTYFEIVQEVRNCATESLSLKQKGLRTGSIGPQSRASSGSIPTPSSKKAHGAGCASESVLPPLVGRPWGA